MQSTTNIIDKNWKALIKPNKLEITSNNDNNVVSIAILSSENMYGDSLILDDENLSEVFYDAESIPSNYNTDSSLDQFYSF